MRQETETRQICPVRILFDNGSTMKDGSIKYLMFFVICLNNIGFPMKGKLIRLKLFFGVYGMRFRIHRYVAALKK
jgi:hypothetical protein